MGRPVLHAVLFFVAVAVILGLPAREMRATAAVCLLAAVLICGLWAMVRDAFWGPR